MLALWVHTLLIVVVLGGIAWRRRWRATLAFPLYLCVVGTHTGLRVADISVGAEWLAWLLLSAIEQLLSLCVAVEIGARIFHRDIPGGRTYTGRVFVAVLSLGLLAALLWGRALAVNLSDRELYFALVEAGRRVALTSMAAFTLLAFMVVSYLDWHLDAYQRDVGAGFLVYRWVFVLLMPWPDAAPILPKVWPVWLYGAVLLLWAWAAWRPDPVRDLTPEERELAPVWRR